jgi:DNA repair protein RadC
LSLKIKEIPETERPYEKLELYGEKALSNAELLAIIIKTGTKEETSVQIAQRILNLNYDPQMGELNFLKSITMEELMQIKGIGRVKAIQIKAICELAIRMSKPSNFKKIQIKCTEQLANLVMEELRFEKREYVKLFLLNNKNEILKNIDTAIGGTNFANVNMKEIIGEALKIKAPKMILVHNHPTGDPTPSKADITFTDRLYNAAKMFDIELIDHIVIGNMNFKSIFVETKKMIEKSKR